MFGNVDSKYRFVILAAKRAKQLLKGAKPKIKAKSRNLIRIAQAEVKSGLIEYEVLPERLEEIPEAEDRVFVGGESLAEEAAEPETAKEGEEAGEGEPEGAEEEAPEEEGGEEGEEEVKGDLDE
jgi:DNA-directed RNA polymerase omega subunit